MRIKVLQRIGRTVQAAAERGIRWKGPFRR